MTESPRLVDNLLSAAATEIGLRTRDLAQAYRTLSDRYHDAPANDNFRLGPKHVSAYLAARLPATYAVALDVLEEIARLRPDWRPVSMLDIGAGPGTAMWAAAKTFSSIDQVTSVEWSQAMIDVGRRLAGLSSFKAVRDSDWRRNSAVAELPASADLVVAGYLIGELAPANLPRTIDNWWSATAGELVIVEPGTPAGFARILQARTKLLAAGATVTAPCPSDETCPMTGSDWCHFSKRLARSSLHRSTKGAELGFEDEKFAYVVASRSLPSHAAGRLLRSPQVRSGHIRLTICEAPKSRELTVTRSKRDSYHWARHARWGDAVPSDVLANAGNRPADS